MVNENLHALRYIINAGGSPTITWFDDDHEPIGPLLRNALLKAGLIKIENNTVLITDRGINVLLESRNAN